MNGPNCPIDGTPMHWLSTWNQWEYYCPACDARYDRNGHRMRPESPVIVTHPGPNVRGPKHPDFANG